MDKQIILIPDVHGRDFWRKAVKGREDSDIIFLGDYLDPYPKEGISAGQALENFYEILQFKAEHPGNVTLLLGNHDLSYIDSRVKTSRFDIKNQARISQLFADRQEWFDLVAVRRISGKDYVFSHAGMRPEWYRHPTVSLFLIFGEDCLDADYHLRIEAIPRVNKVWHRQLPGYENLMLMLPEVSIFRGGSSIYGSMIWSDAREWVNDTNQYKYMQVFGHTQLEDNAVIEDYWADIDTRRAYVVNDSITVLNTTENE